MEPIYVSLEVTKLLEEAGFDWNCKGKFYDFTNDCKIYKKPSLDIAQKWLREVKGIEVNILCVYIDHIKKYSYTVFTNEYEHEIICEGFNTYEDAQDAGIKKALELILKKGK